MEEEQVTPFLRRLRSDQAPEAWKEFLQNFSPLIIQVARLFESDADWASSCYLFVCEKLSENGFRRLRRFRPAGPARFTTWLRAVVRNLCLDWRRKEFGRHRIFRSIARLEAFDQDVFRCVYEQGFSKEESLLSLQAHNPGLTQVQVEGSLERIHQSLTPRQLWLLCTSDPKFEPLEEALSKDEEVLRREIPAPEPDPESLSATREEHAVLERALGRLSKPERLLVRLRFEQALTLQEIARLLDLKDAQTVDRRIRDAIKKLRGEFGLL